MTSPLVNAIAEALRDECPRVGITIDDVAPCAADACIAVVGAMPADYTAVDVLAALRGECACGKPATHIDADPDSDEWACRVPEVTA